MQVCPCGCGRRLAEQGHEVAAAYVRVSAEEAVLVQLRERLDGLAAAGTYSWSDDDTVAFAALVERAGQLRRWLVQYLHDTAAPATTPDPQRLHGHLLDWLDRSELTRRDIHGYLRRVRRDARAEAFSTEA